MWGQCPLARLLLLLHWWRVGVGGSGVALVARLARLDRLLLGRVVVARLRRIVWGCVSRQREYSQQINSFIHEHASKRKTTAYATVFLI